MYIEDKNKIKGRNSKNYEKKLTFDQSFKGSMNMNKPSLLDTE